MNNVIQFPAPSANNTEADEDLISSISRSFRARREIISRDETNKKRCGKRAPINFEKGWDYPEHWTGNHQHAFDFFRQFQGLSRAEAVVKIESIIRSDRVIEGESGEERSWRIARLALASLKPKSRG